MQLNPLALLTSTGSLISAYSKCHLQELGSLWDFFKKKFLKSSQVREVAPSFHCLCCSHCCVLIQCRNKTANKMYSNGLKIVFSLLTKLLTVYMRVPKIEVKEPSFERLLLRFNILIQTLIGIQIGLYELLQKVIGRSRGGYRSGNGSRSRSGSMRDSESRSK